MTKSLRYFPSSGYLLFAQSGLETQLSLNNSFFISFFLSQFWFTLFFRIWYRLAFPQQGQSGLSTITLRPLASELPRDRLTGICIRGDLINKALHLRITTTLITTNKITTTQGSLFSTKIHKNAIWVFILLYKKAFSIRFRFRRGVFHKKGCNHHDHNYRGLSLYWQSLLMSLTLLIKISFSVKKKAFVHSSKPQ